MTEFALLYHVKLWPFGYQAVGGAVSAHSKNSCQLQLSFVHQILSAFAQRNLTMEHDRTMSPSNENSTTTAKSTTLRSESPVHKRLLGRASTIADMSNPLRHRRSSNFSDSVESTRQSIKSSTDNLLLPRATSPELGKHYEPSHWFVHLLTVYICFESNLE